VKQIKEAKKPKTISKEMKIEKDQRSSIFEVQDKDISERKLRDDEVELTIIHESGRERKSSYDLHDIHKENSEINQNELDLNNLNKNK